MTPKRDTSAQFFCLSEVGVTLFYLSHNRPVQTTMENTPADDIFETTRLLKAWSEGDETALERLVPLVDAELRRLARHYLRQERPDHILQTTALVNEAWVRFINWPDDERQSKIVEMRFFGGLSLEETAEALKISTRRRAAGMEYGAGVALP